MILFGFEIPAYAIVLFLLFTLAYFIPILWLHGTHPAKVLEHAAVPVVPGNKPFVGHTFEALKAEHLGKYDYLQLKKFGRVFGLCEFSLPVIVMTDPEMLKEVLVRQFQSFTDRRSLPLRGWMKLSMFDQRGAKWKSLRTMQTPFFSSAKIRNNFVNMNQAASTFVENLNSFCESGESFDAYRLCSAYSLDVIFASAFGIQIDSHKDSNDPLIETVRQISNVSLDSSVPLFLCFTFPALSPIFEKFGITMFPSGYQDFFERAVKKMIKDRLNDRSRGSKVDFMDVMVKAYTIAENNSERTSSSEQSPDDVQHKGLTELEIVAQSMLFILAGWDTVASNTAFLMYNLAVHQTAQERVSKEVDDLLRSESTLTYDNISKLEYLEQCLCESMRLFPSGFRLDREASEDVTIGPHRIPKGCLVVIPLWAIHHDPDVWPEPEKFDPERFRPEIRQEISPYSYMPFGLGLRSCIGNRFALLEMKLAVATVLSRFQLVTTDKTQIPVQLEKGFFVKAKDGLWIGLKRRSSGQQ